MNKIYFLDFDGVLCDSFRECFTSSFIAYYHKYKGVVPPEIDIEHYREFRRLRPFIRRGADYVLLHKMIDERSSCSSQDEFDRILKVNGEKASEEFHKLLYQVRNDMLDTQRDFWLSLNRMYEPLSRYLRLWAQSPCVYILSTKKAQFIQEILAFHGVTWHIDRILYSSTTPKAQIIMDVLQMHGAVSAFFIDDQIDHFNGMEDLPLKAALASWGYVQKDWLSQNKVPVFSLSDFINEMGSIQ
ncbi:MAG: HAD family hydrolase [Spirochaetales bacterium]|nr:HAD family hydrolase [Spirochaetales bacterium]